MNNWELIILNIKERLLSLKKSRYKYILCVCLSYHIVRLHGPTVSNSQTLRRCRESSTALIYTASPVDHLPPSYPCNMKIYAADKLCFLIILLIFSFLGKQTVTQDSMHRQISPRVLRFSSTVGWHSPPGLK